MIVGVSDQPDGVYVSPLKNYNIKLSSSYMGPPCFPVNRETKGG